MPMPSPSRWRLPTRTQSLLLGGALVVTLFGAVGVGLLAGATATPDAPPSAAALATASSTPRSRLPGVALGELPRPAHDTLNLIDRGGPYPYDQDDTVFSNAERLLPQRPAGYYREYTVVTPGVSSRGTRRLVVGALGDVFYTDDHYGSFRQVLR
jgi:ribonuclease T1